MKMMMNMTTIIYNSNNKINSNINYSKIHINKELRSRMKSSMILIELIYFILNFNFFLHNNSFKILIVIYLIIYIH